MSQGVTDQLVGFSVGLGKLYRPYRRDLPNDVAIHLRDLLKTCGEHYQPLQSLTASQNIRVARGDLADAVACLLPLASRPVAHPRLEEAEDSVASEAAAARPLDFGWPRRLRY